MRHAVLRAAIENIIKLGNYLYQARVEKTTKTLYGAGHKLRGESSDVHLAMLAITRSR